MTATATTDERADLLADLAQARAALVGSVEGLDDEQIGRRTTVSALTLGTLIKHVASTEEAWARFVSGEREAMTFDLPEGVTWADLMSGTATTFPQWAIDRQNDFTMLPGDTKADILARYEAVAARTDELVATLDLSTVHALPEAPWNEPNAVRSTRRVFFHLISEISQHAGHADIIRESLDGRLSMG